MTVYLSIKLNKKPQSLSSVGWKLCEIWVQKWWGGCRELATNVNKCTTLNDHNSEIRRDILPNVQVFTRTVWDLFNATKRKNVAHIGAKLWLIQQSNKKIRTSFWPAI